VGATRWSSFEFSHHVETLDREWLGDGDCL
jgi:hypothetical protein